jgi:UDP-N-acetylglucosamine/UDP-N-acetylgalactosamine diphosphorylase
MGLNMQVPGDLLKRLQEFGQEHVLAWWDRIPHSEKKELLAQLETIDLRRLRDLYLNREQTFRLPSANEIGPIPAARLSDEDIETRRQGEELLKGEKVAALVVAGGQGSRLGFDSPKGMFPIGPVSNKSLFQVHAEKVLALSRRYNAPIPLLVMTSPATHAETEQYFEDYSYFGLPPGEIFFFTQGTMPALDQATGKLLLEAPGRLFTSPNGHGGTLLALRESGLLELLGQRGISEVFYFQVDNPLVKIADPLFLGYHIRKDAEVSCKIVPKDNAADKLGNMVLVNGRCAMIEYSDLPEELAQQKAPSGQLRFCAGSPAIHIFSVDFLNRITAGGMKIPFHMARKKVPYLDSSGKLIQPAAENALKFEMFIFDVLPLADRWTAVETSKWEEFVPLKNSTGPNSPTTVRQAISDLAGDWLEKAGIAVPRGSDGAVNIPLEISPLYALDAFELASKVGHGLRVAGPLYLG